MILTTKKEKAICDSIRCEAEYSSSTEDNHTVYESVEAQRRQYTD